MRGEIVVKNFRVVVGRVIGAPKGRDEGGSAGFVGVHLKLPPVRINFSDTRKGCRKIGNFLLYYRCNIMSTFGRRRKVTKKGLTDRQPSPNSTSQENSEFD